MSDFDGHSGDGPSGRKDPPDHDELPDEEVSSTGNHSLFGLPQELSHFDFGFELQESEPAPPSGFAVDGPGGTAPPESDPVSTEPPPDLFSGEAPPDLFSFDAPAASKEPTGFSFDAPAPAPESDLFAFHASPASSTSSAPLPVPDEPAEADPPSPPDPGPRITPPAAPRPSPHSFRLEDAQDKAEQLSLRAPPEPVVVPDGYAPRDRSPTRVREQLRERRESKRGRWTADPGRELSLVLIFVVALATIAVGSFTAKVGAFHRLGRDADSTFWMESAQRFRYVEMVAAGEPIPDPDVRMQAPDGYPPHSDTIVQELLYGRICAHRPGDMSVAACTRVVTRLLAASATLPLAWLAFVATRRRDAALVAALLYGLALPIAERGNGAVLFREDLAFPVLLLHLAALAAWARSRRWWWALAAGVALAGSLLMWKVVSFYALMLLVLLGSVWAFRRAEPQDVGVATLLLFLPAAAACIPPWSLHYDGFLTSTAMLAALGIAIGALAQARLSVPGWAAPVLVLGVLVGGKALAPPEIGYAHAWETIVAKLTTFDTKPLDPTELSFHARHYWTGNYESPTLLRLARDLAWLGAAALFGVVCLAGELRRNGAPYAGEAHRPPPTKLLEGDGPSDPMPPLLSWFCLWLVLGFLSIYLLFSKFALFAVAALALLGALGWACPRRLRTARRLAMAPFIVGVALHGLTLIPGGDRLLPAQAAADAEAVSAVAVFPPDAFQDLTTWIGGNTGVDEPILASFPISPFLLTYLDRPTVLHCFFEGDLMPRLERITHARFADEDTLWRAARDYDARWYVHEAHHTLRTDPGMSQRYVAAAMEWPADSALVRMQYAPETLERFELAWQNDWFRVFRVLEDGEAPAAPASSDGALWSRSLFAGFFGDPLGPLTPTPAGAGRAPADLLYASMKATSWLRYAEAKAELANPQERFAEMEYGLQKALEVAPFSIEAHEALASLYTEGGRPDRAARSQEAAHRARALRSGAASPTPADAPAEVPRSP